MWTTAAHKIIELRNRIRIVQGGTSAGKTYSILHILIYLALKKKYDISIVSESIPHLRRGAVKDFLKLLPEWGLPLSNFNKSFLTYHFDNGSIMEFFSADQPDKLRGARRDILFVNECNNIDYDSFTELEVRTKEFCFLDYNPTHEFWVQTELISNPEMDTGFVKLTYKDNEALSRQIITSIESRKKNEYWWKIYGEGEIGILEGAIFKNWTTGEFNVHLPYAFGLDFGFFPDPTALVKVAIDNKNRKIYLKEYCYAQRLSEGNIIEMLNVFVIKDDAIVADCAESRLIDAIYDNGFNIIKAEKGAGSVREGLIFMQDFEIIADPESRNLIKELSNYSWNDKRAGIPIDKYNHCFSGDTLISTINGYVAIDSIKEGDFIITSFGKNRVLKTFNNGLQQTNKYTMLFDTFIISLEATKDHLIKTSKGWKKISELQSGMGIYLSNNLTEKHTGFIPVKNTSIVEQKECIVQYGNYRMELYQKGFMYITKMGILGIIDFLIWNLSNPVNTLKSMVKKGTKKIQNGLKSFKEGVLLLLHCGIGQTKEEIGIKSMGKTYGKTDNIKKEYANNVEVNIPQDTQEYQSSAIIIAKLRHLEVGEEKNQKVYDLMIENNHEYFANGILVHNCIDSSRYGLEKLRTPDFYFG